MKYSYEIFGGSVSISDVNGFMERIQVFSKKNSLMIQCFNADLIFDRIHLVSTVEHAMRSYDEGRMTTNSIEMELMIYAAGERQLKNAIPKMGVNDGENNIAVVFISFEKKVADFQVFIDDFVDEFEINRDDCVLNGSKDVLLGYGITPLMIETVSKKDYDGLILEQIALIDILK